MTTRASSAGTRAAERLVSKRHRALALAPAFALLVGSSLTLANDSPVTEKPFPIVGITGPYQEATLAAIQPGRIARIATPEGSVAEKGGLVFALEDGVQRARTEMAKSAAESMLEIELAQVGEGQELLHEEYIKGSCNKQERAQAAGV